MIEMRKVLTFLGHAVAIAIAYPGASLLVVVLMILLITQGIASAITALVVIAVAVGAAHVWTRPLVRTLTGVRRRWTHLVFEMWKLRQHRRHIQQSEQRVRTTVTDSVADRATSEGDDRA